ncbi:MAG TPA: tetrahydrofolate dehydrogenase/cyclohydrolase catalytic domain-containing protein [Bacteroidales bacterium]|nr:tetrahydrofolate dehydrogenase/cyclohydrolase catalytic domain-containing protein [Bacteroidales bacterium]HOK99342.1 tetrahydrofolate dehydrogenase/cyclohydrolase catalytic domain-containing protein [Bacteroidales bacterium]HPO65848.1 tetrahydrofolate dehydrogenase/cyclohydrolase catalytic domain-containing protein [Bacteroidales bacterium]
MILIDGKATAAEIRKEISEEALRVYEQRGYRPHLAAILVGHDGGSETYVAHKVKDCEEVGFDSTLVRFEDNVSEAELLDKIQELNANPRIDGIIVQLPLPSHINEQKVIETIDYRKDVDGFHPVNVGRMVIGLPTYISATPFGIVELLKRYQIPTAGKTCVVVGRSNIVGRPLSILLSRKGEPGDCTVIVCHSRTPNIQHFTLQADILVAALGNPHFIKADMVKEGAVVIDVGTTRVASATAKNGWKLMGDVDFDTVAPKCAYITPVPGGVGPMTRVGLLYNTLLAAERKIYP